MAAWEIQSEIFKIPLTRAVREIMPLNRLSLRVQSDVLSAEELTEIVGFSPDDIRRKGHSVSSRSSSVHKETQITYLTLRDWSDEHDSELGSLLRELLPHIENLAMSVGDESLSAQIWVAFTARAQVSRLVFDAELLDSMARAQVALYLDAFPPED